MLFQYLTPYLAELKLLGAILAIAGAFSAGWHERDVRAERDQAVDQAGQAALRSEQFRQLAEQQGAAIAAARRYTDAAAALRPQFQVIDEKAAPILVTLAGCPVPADALGLLDDAASWADRAIGAGGAGFGTDGPGSAPGALPPANGR